MAQLVGPKQMYAFWFNVDKIGLGNSPSPLSRLVAMPYPCEHMFRCKKLYLLCDSPTNFRGRPANWAFFWPSDLDKSCIIHQSDSWLAASTSTLVLYFLYYRGAHNLMVSHYSAFRVFFLAAIWVVNFPFGVIYVGIQDHDQILKIYLVGKYRGNWNHHMGISGQLESWYYFLGIVWRVCLRNRNIIHPYGLCPYNSFVCN